MKICAYCEIDKWATKFYENAFNTENEVYFDDATKIDTRELPDFDVLLAGFPCQPFSLAGKRRGFEDTRGTMFFEVLRILRDKKPRYFILENVKGLLSHDGGKTFQTILKLLADLGLYTVEWALLNSKHFGVPQNRERVFIVGYPRKRGVGKIFPLGEAKSIHFEGREVKEKIHNVASCLKARDCANWGGNFIFQLPRGKNTGGIKEVCPTITKNCWEHNNFLIDCYNHKILDGEIVPAVRQTFRNSAPGNGCKLSQNGFIRRFTPTECFRLFGYSEEVIKKGSKGISDTQLYKIAGNSVVVNVVYEIAKKIVELEREVQND